VVFGVVQFYVVSVVFFAKRGFDCPATFWARECFAFITQSSTSYDIALLGLN
jgi:hypothetical protein